MNTDRGSMPGSIPIATQATPSGRGSIATLILDGPGILARIETLFRPASRQPLRVPTLESGSPPFDQGIVRFGHWNHDPSRSTKSEPDAWEEVVISVSVTSPRGTPEEPTTHVEVQCHGGDRAANSILKSLETAGFRILSWNAWLATTKSIFECETTESLAKATTQRTALSLLQQGRQSDGTSGLVEREIVQITSQLLGTQSSDREASAQRLRTLIHHGRIGQHLAAPWQVAVVGEPNVGKSSLVNALVGFQRAIVYDQPGTTRDELETAIALDGWPMQLWDTAGLRETGNEVEGQGIYRATERLKQSDLILHVRDAHDAQKDTEKTVTANHFLQTIEQHANVLVVWNKIDLLPAGASTDPDQSIKTSATQGTGLDDLKDQIVQSLILDSIHSRTPLLFTQRQVAHAEQALAFYDSGQVEKAMEQLTAILR